RGAHLFFRGRLDDAAEAEDLALDGDLVAAAALAVAGRLDAGAAAGGDDFLLRHHAPGPLVARAIERAVLLVAEAVADELLQRAGQVHLGHDAELARRVGELDDGELAEAELVEVQRA